MPPDRPPLVSLLPLLCGAAFTSLVLSACLSAQQPPPGASGREIYELQLCANCHGEAGEGTSRGPRLVGLAKHWSPPSLVDFLAHTERWEQDEERIRRLAAAYSGDMRGYDNLSRAERTRLAEYLFGL